VGPLAQLVALDTVDTDTVLTGRPGLRWRLSDDGTRLELADRTITVPATCGPAVRAALTAGPVRVGDLPGLDDQDRIVLVRRLLRESVLIPSIVD
jgi:lysine-specific demethylase/histidyl-hydroxylase NO66